MAKGLEAQLFLARGACIMLTANLWTAAGLVNGSMGTVHDIIYNDQGPSYLPTVVFISFDKYKGPTITALDGTKCLAWAITVHKSQELTLPRVKIDLGAEEFAAVLTGSNESSFAEDYKKGRKKKK
ncbi:7415_t:CDS:2, partial [Paraglomus occultum]